MAGIYGDDEQQPTGLLGMLQNPMSQAYLAMILKGLSPHSEIDPQAMVAQAQRLQLAQQERRRADQARREAMDQRERFHQDMLKQQQQDFGLRERQADAINAERGLTDTSRHLIQQGLKPGTPEYVEAYKDLMRDKSPKFTPHSIENPDGSKTTVFQGPGNKFYRPDEVIPGYTAPSPTNPYSTGGKLTESEGKAGTYADRMVAADEIITKHEDINTGTGYYLGTAERTNIPGVGPARDTTLFNTLASKERQASAQAQRNWITSKLRRESGAQINPSEYENERNTFFPQPGDDAKTIEQKREARRIAAEGMMREAGRGYKPPEGWGGKGSKSEQTKDAPIKGAKQAADGKWYVPDPNRPGKYLRVDQ